jgi:SAM-dependent methyltransferase
MADRVSFQLADAMSLPFDAGSFDGSWALECLFHMPDRPRVLREIARVLRPAGRLVIADLIERIPMSSDEKQFFQSGLMVNSGIGQSDYLRTIQDAGFEVVEALDITPNIQRTFPLSLEALERREADLRKAFGEEPGTMMKAMFHRGIDIYQRYLGYVVFTARKATDPSA